MIDTKVIVPVAATIPQQEPSVEQKKKAESSQVPPTFGQIGFRANGILGEYLTKNTFAVSLKAGFVSVSGKVVQDPTKMSTICSVGPKASIGKIGFGTEFTTNMKKMFTVNVSAPFPFFKNLCESKFSTSLSYPFAGSLKSEIRDPLFGANFECSGRQTFSTDVAFRFSNVQIGASLKTGEKTEKSSEFIKALDAKASYNTPLFEASAALTKLGKCMTLCYAQNINSSTSAAASVIFEKNEKKPEEGAEAKAPKIEFGFLHKFDTGSTLKAKIDTEGKLTTLTESVSAGKLTKMSFGAVCNLANTAASDSTSFFFQVACSPF